MAEPLELNTSRAPIRRGLAGWTEGHRLLDEEGCSKTANHGDVRGPIAVDGNTRRWRALRSICARNGWAAV